MTGVPGALPKPKVCSSEGWPSAVTEFATRWSTWMTSKVTPVCAMTTVLSAPAFTTFEASGPSFGTQLASKASEEAATARANVLFKPAACFPFNAV